MRAVKFPDVLSLEDWKENAELRAELQAILDHPTMRAALKTLDFLNRPSAVIKNPIPGATIMESIVAESCSRVGGSNMLDTLLNLPRLNNDTMKALSDPALRNNPTAEMINRRPSSK